MPVDPALNLFSGHCVGAENTLNLYFLNAYAWLYPLSHYLIFLVFTAISPIARLNELGLLFQ
jgi:hypothetical protein